MVAIQVGTASGAFMRASRSQESKDTRRARRRRLSVWCVALAASLAAGAGLGAEPQPLTTRQMQALSPKDADRMVREDLLSILQPSGRLAAGRWAYLRSVGLTTRGFATEYPGLCRRDVVRVRYAPVDDAAPYPDRPLRPYGVEAGAQFAMRHAPPFAARRVTPSQVWGSDCERLGGDAAAHWFDAPNNLDAARAVNLLGAAVARLEAGTLPAACRGRGCEPVIKDLKPEGLVEILACPTGPGLICYHYQMESAAFMTVVARGDGADADVSPDDVVSVESEVMVD